MHRTFRALRPLASTVPLPFILSGSRTHCSSPGETQAGPIVYLVRHGQAEHNVVEFSNLFSRRQDPKLVDPDLTQVGVEQARTAAATIAKQLADHQDELPSVVVSSTLRRALHTAELAALPNAPKAALLALDSACEIQFWDIWNEPRDQDSVSTEWPQWTIESCILWSDCGSPAVETADHMVARAEVVWNRLVELQAPVVVLVSHGCFLSFFLRRVSLVAGDSSIVNSFFENAEVRRIRLPLPDRRHLQWKELVSELESANRQLPANDVSFWNRFSKRASAVTRSAPGFEPSWAQKEWRYAKQDEDFDTGL